MIEEVQRPHCEISDGMTEDRKPTHGLDDHVTDGGPATVTTQSLGQTLAGARIHVGQAGRGAEVFRVCRIRRAIHRLSVCRIKRDVGSEEEDGLDEG